MKSIRSILHILLGVTLICSCNEATELAHITPNVSLIKYKDIVKIDSAEFNLQMQQNSD